MNLGLLVIFFFYITTDVQGQNYSEDEPTNNYGYDSDESSDESEYGDFSGEDSPRCNYKIPEGNCLRYVGEYIVYDSIQGDCVIQDSRCDGHDMTPFSFKTFSDCYDECVMPLIVYDYYQMATSDSALEQDYHWKCEYRLQEDNCGVFIGNRIVFNSDTGVCVHVNTGCRGGDIGIFSFHSFIQCERTCVYYGRRVTNPTLLTSPLSFDLLPFHVNVSTVKPWPTVFPIISTPAPPTFPPVTFQTLPAPQDSRCYYRRPLRTCNHFIGVWFVFDRNLMECVKQTYGCRYEFVQRNAFGSVEECEQVCRPTKRQNHKCTYKRPDINNCGYWIGPTYVFDSLQQLCVVQRYACNWKEVQPYAFNSWMDCQKTCKPTNEDFTK